MIKIISKDFPAFHNAWFVAINGHHFIITKRTNLAGAIETDVLGRQINGKFEVMNTMGLRYMVFSQLFDKYDKGWREQVEGIQWAEK